MQYAGKSDDAGGEPQAPLPLSHITGGGTGAPPSPHSARTVKVCSSVQGWSQGPCKMRAMACFAEASKM